MNDARSHDPWAWQEHVRSRIVLSSGQERRTLADCRGAVLSQDVIAPGGIPAVAVSAMDGFAVRRSDLAPAGETRLLVEGDLPAAPHAVPALPADRAARIMTGAPVPAGADLVVPVEQTDADPTGPVPALIRIDAEARRESGRHIRRAGEEVTGGAVLAPAGQVVRPALLGLAAALGISELEVRTAPRVDVVVTGDELVREDPTGPGAVRESNGLMLRSALDDLAVPGRAWTCGDDPAELAQTLERAAAGADLVLTTGGIGHGAYDVVKQLLGPAGRGTSEFVHLELRPGGPQGCGSLPDGTPVLHLPGTPVGALVGFHLFVRPLLDPDWATRPVRIAPGPADPARRRSARRSGVLALAARGDGSGEAELLSGSRLTAFAGADLLVLAPGARPAVGQECPALELAPRPASPPLP